MKRPPPERKVGLTQKREIETPPSDHECGFCGRKFPTTSDLYRHQQDEHDPDGIVFSELGLPK